MNISETIRAWKDPEYRKTLSNPPTSPAGSIELTDDELEYIPAAGSNVPYRWPNPPTRPKPPGGGNNGGSRPTIRSRSLDRHQYRPSWNS